jgi:hypothetical protein
MLSYADVRWDIVMGMGLELSLILGVMGTVWTGNPLSLNPGFSIGGTAPGDDSSNILGNLLGLLGMQCTSLSIITGILTVIQENLAAYAALTTGSSPMHRSHATTSTLPETPGR